MEIVQWIQHYFAPSYLIHQSIFTQLNSLLRLLFCQLINIVAFFFAKLKTDPVSPSYNFMMNCLPHPSTSIQFTIGWNSFEGKFCFCILTRTVEIISSQAVGQAFWPKVVETMVVMQRLGVNLYFYTLANWTEKTVDIFMQFHQKILRLLTTKKSNNFGSSCTIRNAL